MLVTKPKTKSDELQWSFEQLRGECYVVRPKNQLGTCGFYPRAWQAYFVTGLHKAAKLAYQLTLEWQRKNYE